MNAVLAVAAVPVVITLLVGGALSTDLEAEAAYAVDVAALPATARELLGDVEAIRADACPELPLVWLVAQVQAESSWDTRAYSPAGAAGLLQVMSDSWTEASGSAGWDAATGPGDTHRVWQPREHLAVALPWMCSNLREMADYVAASGKPITSLDALAVCHIAGCSRVTDSTTGIPSPGEAGCGSECVDEITAYLARIHDLVEQYSRPIPAVAAPGAVAAAYPGGPAGCTVPDPTGTGGCVTPATAWLLTQVAVVFPGIPVSCWDAHAWNPRSDHPLGRGCDYTFGRIGEFPNAEQTALGWTMAEWLRTHADALRVDYLIWQGRIWSAGRADEGWRPYTGGGIYDPHDPTGGHYDHIHISVAE